MYALYKNGYVDEEGNITDEKLVTYCGGIDEIYWFKGRHNYTDEDYFICEVEKVHGEWERIEGTEI